MRSEQEIFDDLATLCISQGYIHAVAFMCFRDNMVFFSEELRPEDMEPLYSRSRLIRTEMTTLIGLMLRSPVDFSLPSQETISEYIECSRALLDELQSAITNAGLKCLTAENVAKPDFNPSASGKVLRELIFYGAESAYASQYRDLASLKYRDDAAWLHQNKGIDLEVGREVCWHITRLLSVQLIEMRQSFNTKPSAEWTMLPGFGFSCDELAARSGHPVESVRAVVEAFAVPESERNMTFTSLHKFNAAYAYPFIRKGHDEFLLLLQDYGISEALYETPFYWMAEDEIYEQTAFKHRGEFAEAFAAERLRCVFGADHVFQNVDILKLKGKPPGEIDVLVLFGDRAIVLQAKSKKLTLKARKGNDSQLQDDFRKAVQHAVDQAFDCAELLGDPSATLRCRDGRAVPVPGRLQEIFLVSIVTDHYPALAFQARQFLKPKFIQRIAPPLVTDVFALDMITEMLESPIRLLGYLRLRALFGDKLIASHERVLLSEHLKRNLWFDNEVDPRKLNDSISSDLDIAMAVRRDSIPGVKTPGGILTRMEGTPFASLIAEIEDQPVPEAIDLGFMLLELGEDDVGDLNKDIRQVLERTAVDGGLHNVTRGISTASTGLTIHCSRLNDREARVRLRHHCQWRKYSRKADHWLGLALRPDGSIQLIVSLTDAREFDAGMKEMIANTPKSRPLKAGGQKIGRNDPCPCGSGKKFKRCCINR